MDVSALFVNSVSTQADVPNTSAHRLYQSLFYHVISPPLELDMDELPHEIVLRVQRYIQRYNTCTSRLPAPDTDEGPHQYWQLKVRHLEQALVALIDQAGIEDLAAQYVQEAVLYYEWEGMSSGPLKEAQFAEDYLNQHPETLLEPYLLLFLMHRYRSAGECVDVEGDSELAHQIAEHYKTTVGKARQHPDILVQFVADYLDRLPSVYDISRPRNSTVLP